MFIIKGTFLSLSVKSQAKWKIIDIKKQSDGYQKAITTVQE